MIFSIFAEKDRMELNNVKLKNTHHGHAIKRLRRTLGMKQDVLASLTGLSQTQISTYEQRKVINDTLLDKFAKALNVSSELIRQIEEDPVAMIVVNNTFLEGDDTGKENTNNNPLKQIIELANEKTALYERLLNLNKEMISGLERLLKEEK